jgi:MFS family permease
VAVAGSTRRESATARPVGRPASQRSAQWQTLLTVCLGYCIASTAINPVSSVLPTITDDLRISVGEAAWLMTSYFLLLVGLVLVMGRLGDLFGHGRIFALGAISFAVGAAICGLSSALPPLIVGRAVQGLGSAMIFGTSLAIIASAISASSRGKAIGILTMASSGSTLLGIWFSTWAVQHLNWHWVFAPALPLGAVAAYRGWRLERPSSAAGSRKIDWAGSVLLFATVSAAMLGMNHLHEGVETFSGGAPYHLSMHLLAISLLVVLIKIEQRAAAPLLRFSLLRKPAFASGVAGNGLAHMSMLATSFLLPFLLERGRALTPDATGLLLIAQQGTMVVCSLGLGYLYDRLRSPWFGASLLGLIVLGLCIYGLVGGALPFSVLVLIAMILGGSLGGFTTVNNTAVMSMAESDQRGFASGLIETTRQFGHALGVALSSGILAGALAESGIPTATQYVEGFQQAALAMGLLSGIGVAGLLWSFSRSEGRLTARLTHLAGG